MPGPGSDKQESELKAREVMTEKEVLEYISISSNNSSLTKSEREGMASLKKRIEAQEIIVYPTDKSGKLAVTTYEMYYKQGEEYKGRQNNRVGRCQEDPAECKITPKGIKQDVQYWGQS